MNQLLQLIRHLVTNSDAGAAVVAAIVERLSAENVQAVIAAVAKRFSPAAIKSFAQKLVHAADEALNGEDEQAETVPVGEAVSDVSVETEPVADETETVVEETKPAAGWKPPKV